MSLPLDVVMMIAELGGPLLQYKLSICSSALHHRMQRLWYRKELPLKKCQFVAEKFPAPAWHQDTCDDNKPFKNAHPSITEHLIGFLDHEILQGRISSRDKSKNDVELKEQTGLKAKHRQLCDISHLSKRDHTVSIDDKYRRILEYSGMGGSCWTFHIFRDEPYSPIYHYNGPIRSTLYTFSSSYLLDFETYDFFDRKNTIILGSDGVEDRIVELDRYHLIVRFDRLNRWVKSYDSYRGIVDWNTLSPEEKAKHRPHHYEVSLQKVLNEFIDVCKLDASCIQLDRERNELHVVFNL